MPKRPGIEDEMQQLEYELQKQWKVILDMQKKIAELETLIRNQIGMNKASLATAGRLKRSS